MLSDLGQPLPVNGLDVEPTVRGCVVHVLGLSGDGQAGRLREERERGRAPHLPGPGDRRPWRHSGLDKGLPACTSLSPRAPQHLPVPLGRERTRPTRRARGAALLTHPALGTGGPDLTWGQTRGAQPSHPRPPVPSAPPSAPGERQNQVHKLHPTVKAARTSQDAGPSNVVS